ncbi:MAG TPA: methyltransferase domain-containing protein [Bacteroidota bacterium]|nr:methyltransferase domain-containing protein [Bacteroidota bacterium]
MIYSFGVLHHTPDIDKCIDEAYRVLKKNGIIMITLYNKYSAFYIIKKLFVDGLLKLWIFKLGIKGLRSTIEFGADGKRIKPLVKLYTKRKAKKLMSNFKIISINIKHLKKHHFFKFGSLLSDLFIKKLENLLGWYIVIKAKK